MRIDQKLNLVFPVDTPDGGTAYVYSMPISRSVFEKYYDVLGKVFSRCFDGQDPKHVALTAPQIAYAALKTLSMSTNEWEGPVGVKAGLVNEIIRLSTVLYVGANGWDSVPLDIAVKRSILDEDNEAEVLSTLIFFTAISKVAPKALAGTFLEMAGSLRSWQFIYLGYTEYMNSLPISTATETTTATTSQVIS
jgi:hypothetical protein